MSNKDFFDLPFDEETLIKLNIYEEYLRKWIPVFLAADKPFVKTINIFDFFSGVGKDINNILGSPLIAISVLMEYKDYLKRKDISINLYLNDYSNEYYKRLLHNIGSFNYDRDNINIEIFNLDFRIAYEQLKKNFKNSANLIFLDQFGVKYVDKKLFQELIEYKVTDLLFFVSSSTFKRFSSDDNINSIIELTSDKVEELKPSEIHRTIKDQYESFVPVGKQYWLAPFSIKKGTNIYGLIFGTGHPLGVEKFLEVCWAADTLTGEANFDIEGKSINPDTPSLFAEMNIPTKIQNFEFELEKAILAGTLNSDKEVYSFMLRNGFLGHHVTPVIQKLRSKKIIEFKNPSFKCSTVWKKLREPKEIKLLRYGK